MRQCAGAVQVQEGQPHPPHQGEVPPISDKTIELYSQ